MKAVTVWLNDETTLGDWLRELQDRGLSNWAICRLFGTVYTSGAIFTLRASADGEIMFNHEGPSEDGAAEYRETWDRRRGDAR